MENVELQSSEEVSYDTLIKGSNRRRNRDEYYVTELSKIIDDVKVTMNRNDLSVLEIGFNSGKLMRDLSEKYKDVKFTGVEVRSNPVIEMQKLGFDCRQTTTEMFDEFFGSEEQFDVIYGFAVLHHLSDPYKSLESLIKLLKPGGVVVFIREDHTYDVVAHLHTTIIGNWAFEKGKFIMSRKRFKDVLRRYSTDYFVKYDNNGIAPCFRRLNKLFCGLKLHRVPFWNSFTVYGKIKAQEPVQ